MMEYNTKQKKLPLPEYGRSVQKMVDHAMTIENREERQQCANTIINIMGNMFPAMRELPDFKRKLWDHLAIMSDFSLDIDYPFEVIKKEKFYESPETIPYQTGEIKNRHYGRIVEDMIRHALTMEDGDEKDKFIELIAVQMKKNYIAWNKDGVEDKRIFEDLRTYSDGKIDITDKDIKIYTQQSSKNDNMQRGNNAKRKKMFKKKY